MKVIELLEAASFTYRLYKGGDFAVSLHVRNNITSIISLDKKPIAQSTNLILIKISSNKLKEWNSTHANKFIPLHNGVILPIINPYILESAGNLETFKENLENSESYFIKIGLIKIEKFNNIKNLSKELVIKDKLPPSVVFKISGINFDETIEKFEKVGESEIIFPDNIKANKIEEISNLIREANDILINNNLGYLTKTKILVSPISGNAIGRYYPNSKHIQIDNNAKAIPNAVQTLIHEYGHKFFYEFLNEEARQKIKKKFNQLVNSIKINCDSSLNNLENIKVGDIITYQGMVKKYKAASPFVVISKNPSKMILVSQDENNQLTLVSNPENFLNQGLFHNGEELSRFIESSSDLGFFPTKYSKTDYLEWFAELFAYKLLNKLKSEKASAFIEGFIK